MYYVYFAESLKNNKIYVGSTDKLPRVRVQEHNQGSNTWSKHNRPLKLIYFETYTCKQCARKRESFYKTGFGREIKKQIVKLMIA